MQDRDYCQSEAHTDLIRFSADWRIAGDNVRLFAMETITQAQYAGVPLHCESAVYGSCDIVHSQYGDLLGEHDWAILAHFGHLASKRLEIAVKHMAPYRPGRWYVSVPARPADLMQRVGAELQRKLMNDSVDELINGNASNISER